MSYLLDLAMDNVLIVSKFNIGELKIEKLFLSYLENASTLKMHGAFYATGY